MEAFDCEALRAGFPKQPINALSSAAFLLAAFWLWRRGHKVAAGSLTVAGVGSVLFHGAPSGMSSWLHDIGLYAVVAVAAAEVWRQMARSQTPWVPLGTLGAGSIIWAMSRTGGPLCSPDSLLQGHAIWHVLAATAVALLFAPAERRRKSDTG